jgi:hypothetical protein
MAFSSLPTNPSTPDKSQQAPQRIQLLLRMRHVRNALLCIIDRLDDVCSQLFQGLRYAMFLRARFATRGACLGLRSNVSVGIEAADRAVAFAEDAAAFFDERLHLVDEFFFVELFFRGTVGFVDVLARDLC